MNILHEHVKQLSASAAACDYSDLSVVFILCFYALSSVSDNETLAILTHNKFITVLLHDLTYYFYDSMCSINTTFINTSHSQTLTLIYNYTNFFSY